jgi:hypothetical protein
VQCWADFEATVRDLDFRGPNREEALFRGQGNSRWTTVCASARCTCGCITDHVLPAALDRLSKGEKSIPAFFWSLGDPREATTREDPGWRKGI